MLKIDQRAFPVLKWAGGKGDLLLSLASYFPTKANRFIEPFLGGAAVFLSLDPKIPAIVSDANSELIEMYDVIRSHPEQLMGALDRLAKKYSEKFYYELREEMPRKSVDRAARLIFLNKTCFNGLYRVNSSGKFNVSFGKRIKCPSLYVRSNLLQVSARLKKAKVVCKNYDEVIDEAKRGDFIYCDPPYAPISVSSSFHSYTADKFSLDEHEKLRDCCMRAAKRGASIIISNSSSPLIQKLFSSFPQHKILAKRSINSNGARRGAIEEVLIQISPKQKFSLSQPQLLPEQDNSI